MGSFEKKNGMMRVPQLAYPYLRIVEIQRWVCRDSVVVVFVVETGERFVILTPFN